MHESLPTDVLIVGAGPTGLMLANWLARSWASPSEIIDGKSGPTTESRALVVQARSMEIYDQLGLVGEVLAEGRGGALLSRPGSSGPRVRPHPTFGELGSRHHAVPAHLCAGAEQERNPPSGRAPPPARRPMSALGGTRLTLALMDVAVGESPLWRRRPCARPTGS